MVELRSAFRDCLVPGSYGPKSEDGPALKISETAVGGLVQLAGWGEEFAKHVEPALKELGLAGIGDFKTAQSDGDTVCFRIAPDRLLLRNPDKSVLDNAFGDLDDAVVARLDLSHARAIMRIEGERAEDLFARLSTIDPRSRHFPAGRFAQTGIHHTGVLIHRLTTTHFEIYIPSSFAVSLWEYVCICAKPFGYDVVK